jgi:hypothetical protein
VLFIKKFLRRCVFCYYGADPADSVFRRFLGRKDCLLGRRQCRFVEGREGEVLLCSRRDGLAGTGGDCKVEIRLILISCSGGHFLRGVSGMKGDLRLALERTIINPNPSTNITITTSAALSILGKEDCPKAVG